MAYNYLPVVGLSVGTEEGAIVNKRENYEISVHTDTMFIRLIILYLQGVGSDVGEGVGPKLKLQVNKIYQFT